VFIKNNAKVVSSCMLVGDSRDQQYRTLFEKPGRNGIRVRLLLGTVELDLEISDSEAGLKVEKSRGVIGKEVNVEMLM